MAKTIALSQHAPKARENAVIFAPIGLYCNERLQKARVGQQLIFQDEWRREKRYIRQISKVRINTPEFTFLFRLVYGDKLTLSEMFKRWEAWAVVEGYGKNGFSREQCLAIEISENAE